MQPDSTLCDPEALATNSRGDLTPSQLRALRSRLPGDGEAWILFAFSVLILGVVLTHLRLLVDFFTFADPFAIKKHLLGQTFSISVFKLFGGAIVLSWVFTFQRGVRTIIARVQAANELKPGRVAWGDGTVAWNGSAYVALLPGRHAPLEPWDQNTIEDFYPGPYRFWYHRRDGWLLSMQPLSLPQGVAVPNLPGGMHTSLADVLANANGFLPEALEANRTGRLSAQQRHTLAQREKRSQRLAPVISIGMIASSPAFWYFGLLQASLVFGVLGIISFVQLLRAPIQSAMDKDLAEGRVLIVEGAARKSNGGKFSWMGLVAGSDNPYNENYYYAVGQERFPVAEKAYHALVDGMPCRLYYLPRSKAVINIEPLTPDASPR